MQKGRRWTKRGEALAWDGTVDGQINTGLPAVVSEDLSVAAPRFLEGIFVSEAF